MDLSPADEPTAETPRDVLALLRAGTELGSAALGSQLEFAQELHGAVGVWIDDLRRQRKVWIRSMHERI